MPGLQTAISARPRKIVALVPLERIAGDLERAEASSPGPDGQPGATLSAPASVPLMGFGVRQGDEIATVNGDPYVGLNQLREALKRNVLALGIRHGEEDIAIHYHDVPIHQTEREIRLARDDAMALLRGLEARMQDLEGVVLEYSQRRSRDLGARLQGRTALDGLWILPPASADDAAVLASFGLAAGDCVTAVNGGRIMDYREALADVAHARTALEGGWSGTVDVEVRRGRYQQMTLQLAIY